MLDTERAESQAKAKLQSIMDMVKCLEADEDYEGQWPTEAIDRSILSLEIRFGWHVPGKQSEADKEYLLLLSWGGPASPNATAVRIVGNLNIDDDPYTARLQYQDWGISWIDYPLSKTQEDTVITYCQQFYFGS